ncbi:MAG: hypothetical protein COC12_07260 [Rhodobacteraceae bacterium]|nr:MAG: hypothetical protein COC12_07260 [Paracoccaceae bacterium]
MIRATIIALLSHWRRHPVQLVTLLAGLALATGLWSAVQAINAEARASYQQAAAQLGGVALPELKAQSGAITLAQYVTLRRGGWQVAPVLEGRTRLGDSWVTVMGIDPLSHPGLPALSQGNEAAQITGFSGLLARPELAKALAQVPGLPTVTGSDLLPPGVVLGDISVVETLLDRRGQISRLLILPEQPMGRPPLADLVPGLVQSTPDRAADTARLTNSFFLNLTAFGLLSFAVGLFIVHGTVGLAFERRRPVLRTLRALGVPLRLLGALLLGELLLLALIAGAVGLVLGHEVLAL